MQKPIILGINRTQDASITLFEGKQHVFSIQKERLTRKRHHWGKKGDIALYLSHLDALKQPIDLIVEGYSCDKEIINMKAYHQELVNDLILHKNSKIIQLSHHLSHAYSAYYPSSYKNAAVMIIDSVGSHTKNFTEKFSVHKNDEESFEVASFYYFDGNSVQCLHKQLWDGNKKSPRGLGQFYFLLTQCIFPGEGREGKVMGLSKWGNPNTLKLPPLEVVNGDVFIPAEWQAIFHDPEPYQFYINGTGYFHDCANLAAAGQKAFEEALLALTQWLAKKTQTTNLCYAGGTALNCSANGMLLKKSPFKNIFIPPAPHDGGTSIGCAIYGLVNHYNLTPAFNWKSDYLGPKKQIILPPLLNAKEEITFEQPDNLFEEVIQRLLQGDIMALFQGNSEFGPRALGHRSIIADPRYRVITDWINQHIKWREWFRPIAPFILDEDLETVFDIDRQLPHMLYAIPVRSQYKEMLSAAMHIDGTARVQSVSEDINPFLYKLLQHYKEKIGVGVLLNTSFNRQGEPIIETFEEAMDCFLKTPLHALLIPPYIIRKKNAPENPLRI